MFLLDGPSEIIKLSDALYSDKGIEVYLKREDQLDEEISGNKWRKLKYNFIHAKNHGYQTILTFGGAYSNHIAATASAAKKYGLKSIGIIRGDELNENSNATLKKAHDDGMTLQFISRSAYKNRNDKVWLKNLKEQYAAYLIPEGGSNALAIKGVAELIEEINIPFDYVICPVGTGGTLAGIICAINEKQKAIGIASLNGMDYLKEHVKTLLPESNIKNWNIIDDFTFGGYGKFNEPLINFIPEFKQKHGIPLDPIYTGKMMYGLNDMVLNGKFPKGTKILAIHTGGLQGIKGFNEKYNLNL